jgi:hypothetical protein
MFVNFTLFTSLPRLDVTDIIYSLLHFLHGHSYLPSAHNHCRKLQINSSETRYAFLSKLHKVILFILCTGFHKYMPTYCLYRSAISGCLLSIYIHRCFNILLKDARKREQVTSNK